MIHHPFNSARRALVCTAAMALLAGSAQALVFTFSTTVSSDPTGTYSVGQSVNFTFDVNTNHSATYGWYSPGGWFGYYTEDVTEDSLWLDVSGEGLGGAWALPSDEPWAPFDFLQVNPGMDRFDVFAGTDSGPIGLTANGNNVNQISFAGTYTGLDLADPGSSVAVSDYFQGYYGTYAANTQSSAYVGTAAGSIQFSLVSLTISATAIPEAAAALPIGLLALLVGLSRRRR